MSEPFEPEDPEDALFHGNFAELREAFVHVARDLADRVKQRVSESVRAQPRVSDVLLNGLAELFNVLARAMGSGEDPRDE
jgi:hypothetical protein